MTNVVSTYQTSQAEFDLCDRVIIIYEGCVDLSFARCRPGRLEQLWLTIIVLFSTPRLQVFSGLTADAEKYFVEQGWQRKPRQRYIFSPERRRKDLY